MPEDFVQYLTDPAFLDAYTSLPCGDREAGYSSFHSVCTPHKVYRKAQLGFAAERLVSSNHVNSSGAVGSTSGDLNCTAAKTKPLIQ